MSDGDTGQEENSAAAKNAIDKETYFSYNISVVRFEVFFSGTGH